ncbi:MAG: acyl-CoA dehydrogenase C-terminal domain-containing protein [Devosia sp.]
MPSYVPPVDDMTFLLRDVFDFDAIMAALPRHAEVNTKLAESVLEEAGKFCAQVLEPLNRSGDEQGCTLAYGEVSTPRGFPDAYRQFTVAGWASLSGNPDYDGQGLPRVLQIQLDEMVSSTNLSFGLFPGLTRGAVEALSEHASAALKTLYLPKMISGEWTGAMALTEASAGTDLGLLTTRSEPIGDGSYAITGTKIFISSGDHDFGGNIAHLVLARLPDAPKGVKGISLFLVPKFLPDSAGNIGARNGMSVGSLEHKMGIHGQPTCMMNYENATGWLVGEAGRGLNAMFTMMNSERLFVGIQGLGIAEAACQKATAYAKERLQGRSANGAPGPVPIIQHPDVRKMLLTGRAFADGARALATWTALQMDIAATHPDAKTRQDADGLVALLTPVIKAAFTDMGFETAVLSQQVFGGHGYIREWGMEQYVRDARITQIYEGTNGVQAMDLVGRKLAMEDGQLPRRFFGLIRQDLDGAARHDELLSVVQPVAAALTRLESLTHTVQARSGDTLEIGAAATDYLRVFALVALGWVWVKMAAAAIGSNSASAPQRRRKIQVARFYVARMLPMTVGLEVAIGNAAETIMALDAELL